MAAQVLQMNGDTTPLGKEWVARFHKHNPKIGTCVGKRIDTKRIDGTQPEKIQEFYDLFEKTQKQYNVSHKDVWNMDEHGLAQGISSNAQVLAGAGKKKTFVQAPANHDWATVVEAVNAVGQYTRPLVIFKGVYLQSSWFEQQGCPDWKFATSENGWTSNEKTLMWLEHIFIPETVPTGGGHRILVLDGHGSHATIDFLWKCKINDVHLIFLPAHSSHVLQPLDLAVFSPLKTHYRNIIASLAYIDDAAPVKKLHFISSYKEACLKTFVPRVIMGGWKAAGVVPFNPSKGLNSSQLRIQPVHPKTPPNPPLLTSKLTDPLLHTPRNPQHVLAAL